MAAMTDFMENKLIDFLFRGQALGIANSTATAGYAPTSGTAGNLYVGLLTTMPTADDGTGAVEVTVSAGTNYARQPVPCNAMSASTWAGTQSAGSTTASSGSGGTTSNNNAITFGIPNGTSWGTIAGFAVYDAPANGNMLFYGTLTGGSKTVSGTDPAPSFAAGALTFQIDT